MMRVLSNNYDRATPDAEALMQSEISKLSSKQCKDLRELADRLTELEKASESFIEKIGRPPADSLLGFGVSARRLLFEKPLMPYAGILISRFRRDLASGSCLSARE